MFRRGGPDAALSVWVAEQQEVICVVCDWEWTSCSCVTQTCKATSGSPRQSVGACRPSELLRVSGTDEIGVLEFELPLARFVLLKHRVLPSTTVGIGRASHQVFDRQ